MNYFINKIKNKDKYCEKTIIAAADFETNFVNMKIHKVFAWCIISDNFIDKFYNI